MHFHTYVYVCRNVCYTQWPPMSNKYILMEMYLKYMYNTTKMLNKVPGSGKWVMSFKVFISDRSISAE